MKESEYLSKNVLSIGVTSFHEQYIPFFSCCSNIIKKSGDHRRHAHLGTPVQGCRRWGCLWFGGWATPLLPPLLPQLPPAPHDGCTGRRMGWNGDKSLQGVPRNPHCRFRGLGTTGHSQKDPRERPTPWPSTLNKRGTEGGGGGRGWWVGAPEGRMWVHRWVQVQKSGCVCVCLCVRVCGLCRHENCSSVPSACPTSTLGEFRASPVLSCSGV